MDRFYIYVDNIWGLNLRGFPRIIIRYLEENVNPKNRMMGYCSEKLCEISYTPFNKNAQLILGETHDSGFGLSYQNALSPEIFFQLSNQIKSILDWLTEVEYKKEDFDETEFFYDYDKDKIEYHKKYTPEESRKLKERVEQILA